MMLQRDSLRSHSWPSQPSGQKHCKEFTPSMQVPPFPQGLLMQSLISGRVRGRRGGGGGLHFQQKVVRQVTLFILSSSWALQKCLEKPLSFSLIYIYIYIHISSVYEWHGGFYKNSGSQYNFTSTYNNIKHFIKPSLNKQGRGLKTELLKTIEYNWWGNYKISGMFCRIK